MKDIEIPVTKVFGGGIHSGVLNKQIFVTFIEKACLGKFRLLRIISS
jgi:hypothetical protein